MGYCFGMISVATTDKAVAELFKEYPTYEDKINATWKDLDHVFFYDYDGMKERDVFENIELFRDILRKKSISVPDLFILQSSKDGFHIVSPEIFNFDDCNRMMRLIPDDIEDKKIYPDLVSRDFDRFATLRLSEKFSKWGTVLKERPKLISQVLGDMRVCKVSRAHLNFFGLPRYSNYVVIDTIPILVKYTTWHRLKEGE